METRANYALIGLFTLAVIAAGFAFVLWFSGSNQQAARVSYRIVFTSSVAGLSRGADVTFNGLKVGEVSSIQLGQDPSQVEGVIAVDRSTPIKTDTRAQLEYAGLTGVASVGLTGGSASAPALASGQDGQLGVIHADRSDFQSIVDNIQGLSARANTILDKADKLLDDNGASVTDTIHNVDQFTQALAQNSGGVSDLMAGLTDLSRTIKPLSTQLTTLSSDVDSLVKAVDPAQVKDIVANADQFAQTLGQNKDNISSVLADAAQIGKQLQSSATKLDSVLDSANAVAKSIDPNKVASLIDNANSLASASNAAIKSIDTSKVNDAISKIDNLTGAVSADALQAIVANVGQFSQALGGNKDNIDTILGNGAKLTTQLGGTANQLDDVIASANSVVKAVDPAKVTGVIDNANNLIATTTAAVKSIDTAKVNDAIGNIDALTGSVTPAAVQAIVTNVGQVTASVAANKANIDSILSNGAKLTGQLGGTADQLDDVLAAANTVVKSVDPAKVSGIVDNANRLVAAVAPDTVHAIVTNVGQVTETIAANKDNIDAILNNGAKLSTQLGGTADSINTVLASANTVVKAIDPDKVRETVNGVQNFAAALDANSPNVDAILKNTNDLTAKLNGTADKLDGLIQTAQEFLGSSSTKGVLADVSDAAQAIRKLADNLDVRTKDISAGLTRFTGSGLRNYDALATDGRKTLDSVNRTINSLGKNPQQLLFGAKPTIPEYSGGR